MNTIPIVTCRLVRDGRRKLTLPATHCRTQFDAAAAFRALMRPETLPHEEVWIILLNGSGEPMNALRISQGGLHGCALTPRDILRPVIAGGASTFIMCHNHPSGDPTPSVEDVEMTRATMRACTVVGCELLDHIVLGGSSYRSVRSLC